MKEKVSFVKLNLMKVALVGDSAVGKTSIINAICNKNFNNTEPTINYAKYDITIKTNTDEVSLCLWDTAGQESYQALAPLHARGSKVQLLVYDVTDSNTFNNLQRWLDILSESNNIECIFVVGNKIDMPEDKREVTFDDALEYATKIGASYCEVSAKTKAGIEELFDQIANKILEMKSNNIPTPETNDEPQPIEENKSHKSCC